MVNTVQKIENATAQKAKNKAVAGFEKTPVVVVLGHVDHGKTSLLDYIRSAKIALSESGGITQHIGAYQVEKDGFSITFIDTPGHEAFSAMRARGAKVADIALLVIAADDGVKPQTKEAIKYIKESDIPFIVVFSKIDKPEAEPAKAKNQLLEDGVMLEGYGGDIPSVEVSATTGQGIGELLDLITLVAQVSEIKADVASSPSCVVVESFHNARQGAGATLITQRGIVRVGSILAGKSGYAKVRSMENDRGERIQEAPPGTPFVIYGFNEVVRVGEVLEEKKDAKEAKGIFEEKEAPLPPTAEELKKEEKNILYIIIKADVNGTLEAALDVARQIEKEDAHIKILFSGAGDISDSDIRLSLRVSALILGFRVKTTESAKVFLRNNPVIEILYFETIYDLAEGIRKQIEDRFGEAGEDKVEGALKVLKVFRTEQNRAIVGGRVLEGIFSAGPARVTRDGQKKGEGNISEIRKVQKVVERVSQGEEAGIQFIGYSKIEQGDILERVRRDK